MAAASRDAERPSSTLERDGGGRGELIEVLRGRIAELEVRLVERDAVIAELRAQLGQNSRNS